MKHSVLIYNLVKNSNELSTILLLDSNDKFKLKKNKEKVVSLNFPRAISDIKELKINSLRIYSYFVKILLKFHSLRLNFFNDEFIEVNKEFQIKNKTFKREKKIFLREIGLKSSKNLLNSNIKIYAPLIIKTEDPLEMKPFVDKSYILKEKDNNNHSQCIFPYKPNIKFEYEDDNDKAEPNKCFNERKKEKIIIDRSLEQETKNTKRIKIKCTMSKEKAKIFGLFDNYLHEAVKNVKLLSFYEISFPESNNQSLEYAESVVKSESNIFRNSSFIFNEEIKNFPKEKKALYFNELIILANNNKVNLTQVTLYENIFVEKINT
ncbi:hypothetical protein H312_02726 [Anncaliia algerae PRA339]|uniref:Uncharacterized protein n=1 Tax=Anncaliia algerae PRA339 TaxID=1288291 RepID=A0A059EYR9_9MICR|nr:hypothetical protein H312_02726 [Anncaliia algerae PRA339]